MVPIHNTTNNNIPNSSPNRRFFHGVQSFENKAKQERYLIRGFTEPCPQQAGIPGWRRICFIIYRLNPDFLLPGTEEIDGDDDNDGGAGGGFDETWCPFDWWTEFLEAYAYEGIVVPGGKIMMGRWMDVFRLEESGEMGPFIFWEA